MVVRTVVVLVALFVGRTWQAPSVSPRNATDFRTEHAREVMRLAKAAEMSSYLDPTVDPCHDFYRFACGNWHKINPANREPKTGIFNALSRGFDRKLEALLRSPKMTSESQMERKVKYFYESCLDREQIRSNYREKLLAVLEEFGGMPALKGHENWPQEEPFDWLRTTALILRKYGLQIIVGVDVSADLTNNQVNRLYIGQPEGLVPSRATQYYERLQIAWQLQLQQLLGLSLGVAAQTAAEMVDFQRELAKGMADPHEGLGLEDLTRLRLLDEMSENYKPWLDLARFVGTWLGHEYRVPVYEYVESYNRNLHRLMAVTPSHVVGNYIMWQLAQELAIEVADSEELQRRECLKLTKTHFIKYVEYMVYRQMKTQSQGDPGRPDVVAGIGELWAELKSSFEERLRSPEVADWMTNSTRDRALEKLSAMSLHVNSYESEDFDREYGQLVISTDDCFANVLNILELRGRNYRHKIHEPPRLEEDASLSFTPAYVPELNRVLVPVEFLQPRYLWDDEVYPRALKYATVGYVVAHELAHGFDDTVRKYDARGNLNNWWDKRSTEGFLVRKECLRQQYARLRYGGRKLQPSNAQGENIADNAGLRIAHRAYQRWLESSGDASEVAEETLPRLKYSPQQLFFIGAAQVWCTDVKPYWRQIFTATDVHAPEEVRVAGMLANFDEFALEFQCPMGTSMNPSKKCLLY